MINGIISPEFSEFLKLLFTWFEIIAVILYEYKAITKNEDTKDNRTHLYYDESAAEGYWYVGADALTTIARDLIYKVGNAEYCISSNIYPALEDYKTELYVIVNDFDNAVSPDEGKNRTKPIRL